MGVVQAYQRHFTRMVRKPYTVTAVSGKADEQEKILNILYMYVSNYPHKQSRLYK